MGLDLYEEEKWLDQAERMAEALDSYHLAYNNCSLLCEEGYDVNSSEYDSNHEAVGALAGWHVSTYQILLCFCRHLDKIKRNEE